MNSLSIQCLRSFCTGYKQSVLAAEKYHDLRIVSNVIGGSRRTSIRLFRAKSKQHTELSMSNQGTNRMKLLAKGLKLIRIPVLIISVYGLGYNQGIMDYARNPEKKRVGK